jgi:hypothetical protein
MQGNPSVKPWSSRQKPGEKAPVTKNKNILLRMQNLHLESAFPDKRNPRLRLTKRSDHPDPKDRSSIFPLT